MKKILALTFPLLLAVLSARADLIWYEGFNYANGSLTNVSSGLWIKTSGTANPSDMFVNNKKVEISATGGTVSRQDDCYRKLALTPNSPYTNGVQVMYASFTVICTNLPNGAGSYFATFYNVAAGFYGRIQALTNGTVLPNTWRLGISAQVSATATKVYPVDLALNTPYQVVVQWDPITLLAATVWINPITSSDPSATSTDGIGTGNVNPINAFAFRQAGTFGNSFFQVTNLAMATTFAEAATNVWATNAVPPVIAYQPTAVTTNFQNVATSLSAVANGQGQGSLTYQWQVSANAGNTSPANVSNPNGNSNILGVDSSTIGNNYYTLVVTTPWGLSTTSSVAKVAILAPVGPPSFTSQPASQTVYNGQTVTLTTTVLSPGNTTYTWYSNNVVVTGGQTDSGLSSSYTLNNVTLSSSATYKVAVTNDTSATGIVSTNAVITVVSAPIVTIAYLRTLVDPTTFQATNNPPTIPYQITGIVSTYTNITQGNTASYYLQDGTAGINIFATLGQTFRPLPGDSVTFVGVVSSFSSGLELYADTTTRTYTSYTINSSGNPVYAPRNIPFNVTNAFTYAYVNTNLAGSLVTITNVYFGTNFGTVLSTTANQTIAVTNASGQSINLTFFFVDLDTAGQTLPQFASSVTGVLYGNHPNFSIGITKFSDIVTNAISVLPIPLTTTYAGGSLTFNWGDASFALQNSTNVVGPYITIPGAGPGFVTNTTQPTMFFRLYHP